MLNPGAVLVSLRSDAYYRGIAEEALKRASVQEPPVSVEDLAAGLGIPVRQANLPTFFSGAIIAEDGMPAVLLNAAHEEDKRRRTLAHLLGHVLVVLADSESSYPRQTRADHHEAEIAAEELLLPEYLVLEQAQKWFNDHRYLARLFGVAESEMMRRMLDLGIMKQRGILWDY